jgi:hypothetical protein
MRIQNCFLLEMLLPLIVGTGETGTGGWEPSAR